MKRGGRLRSSITIFASAMLALFLWLAAYFCRALILMNEMWCLLSSLGVISSEKLKRPTLPILHKK